MNGKHDNLVKDYNQTLCKNNQQKKDIKQLTKLTAEKESGKTEKS